MKCGSIFVPCLLALLGLQREVQAQKQPDSFTFLNITDSHQAVAGAADPIRQLVSSSVDAADRPAFIVDTGGVTQTGAAEEFDRFKEAIAPLGISKIGFYAVPGNHDVRWSPNGKEGFNRVFGKTYQSFDYSGAHFLLLDSTVLLEHWGHLEKAELDWLDKDLKKVKPDTPIFLFLHHPIGRESPSKRLVDNEYDLINRMPGHNVVAIFTGHDHADLEWKTNGVETVECRGLNQGSYYRVSVTPVLVTIDRVYTRNPGPAFHVTIPISRRAKPSQLKAGWDDPNIPFLERKRPAATLEPRAVSDFPDKEKAEYRIEDGPWKPMTKDARDIWRDVFPTRPIPVGVHSATVRLTTSSGVALSSELIFEVERSETEPTQRWAINLDGPIQSTPKLAEDTLYVTCLDGKLYALGTDKGKRRWLFPTKGAIVGSPLLQDDTLYFGSTDHFVYAVDARTGKQRWKFDTGSPVMSTPAVAAGVLCVGGDHKIYGIDIRTGDRRWMQPAGSFFQSRAASDGSAFYLGGWDNNVYALDAAAGAPRWIKKLGREFYYAPAIASPFVANGRVYVCTNDNTLHTLNARTGDIVWEFHAPGTGDPLGYSSPVVNESSIYVAGLGDHGDVYALNSSDGSIRWRCPTGQAIYDSSPRLAPDGKTLAIMGVRGKVSIIDTGTGRQSWGYDLGPGNIFSTPEYDGSTVYTVTMADDVQAIAGPNSDRPSRHRAQSSSGANSSH